MGSTLQLSAWTTDEAAAQAAFGEVFAEFDRLESLLMAFLVDIDLLYFARIARHLGGGEWLGVVIGVCTIALAAISLWIAFALLINPVAGRAVFAFPGPVFRPKR